MISLFQAEKLCGNRVEARIENEMFHVELFVSLPTSGTGHARLLERQLRLHAHDAVVTSQWQWDFSCAV
ncbi:Putative GTP cyclohydrolase [Pseudomonas putida ND6]|uniref:Putative GTP cyclohydrolase n=1 Tax=Pseudomonas putida ND6 TaxID=231023 RepID=I3UVD4_PSEPU|nr:Putative GTP cyclohydrolase [Pseudomonas putida ND6]